MKKAVTYPEIRMGSEGDLVVQLQTLLCKSGSNVKTDGKFSIGTRSALVKYQKKNGLEPTGICGKETWSKLMEVANVKTQKVKKAAPEAKNGKDLTLEEKVEILWKEHLLKNSSK